MNLVFQREWPCPYLAIEVFQKGKLKMILSISLNERHPIYRIIKMCLTDSSM